MASMRTMARPSESMLRQATQTILRRQSRVPATPILATARSLCSTTKSSRLALRSARVPAFVRPPSTLVQARSYATEGSAPPASDQPEPVSETPAPELSRTPLYDLHVKHQARLVPFAGYEMPLTYKWGGQLAEHAQVRNHAGIFDVSHMVQSVISGEGATKFVQHLIPASTESLRHHSPGSFGDPEQGPFLSSLSVLLNEEGGILDDLIVTRQGEEVYYLVTNAGRKSEDLIHIRRELRKFNSRAGQKYKVKHDVLEGRGLIALQGPKAAQALQNHVPIDLSKLYFGESIFTTLGPNDVRVHISRGGYTGEDGFEISVPEEDSIAVTELLLSEKSGVEIQLIGLAARDSLRLEAGMCLYGHDLSEDVGPLEAGLTWTVGEDRRSAADFIGARPVLDAMATKAKTTRRVGLVVESGSVPREGAVIYASGAGEKSEPIGKVTSGIPSPSLKQNIAMGYVKFGHHKVGTELDVKGRGMRKAKVIRMPFLKNNYYRRPKDA